MWTKILTVLQTVPNLIKDNPHALNGVLFVTVIILGYLLFSRPQVETTKTVIERDTTVVTQIDTVRFTETEYIVEVDSIPVPVTIEEGEPPLNHYTTPFADSRLSGEIESRVRGYLVSQSFSYTPLFPKYIQFNKTTTIRDYRSVTRTIRNRSFNLGVEAHIVDSAPSFFVEGSYVSKSDNIYSIGYDPFNNSYSVGVSISLFK